MCHKHLRINIYYIFLTALKIGKGVTNIMSFAFYQCSGFAGALLIPDSVTVIGYSAFQYCSFTGMLRTITTLV